MVNGLGYAPEHQADAHAGAEQHRQPTPGRKLGAGIGTAEADIAVAAQQQVYYQAEVDVDRGDE